MHTCQRVDCFIQMKSSSNTPRGPQLEENGKARGPRPICQKKKRKLQMSIISIMMQLLRNACDNNTIKNNSKCESQTGSNHWWPLH